MAIRGAPSRGGASSSSSSSSSSDASSSDDDDEEYPDLELAFQLSRSEKERADAARL